MPIQRLKLILGALALTLVLLIVGCANSEGNPLPSPTQLPVATQSEKPTAIVTNEALYPVDRVIDGDTVVVKIGDKFFTVRYIGINTPEITPVECFGKEATEKNRQLVEGKKVRLEKDVSETDQYGRLLRYVYLEDGTFVNETLVRTGYAHAVTYPPDVKHQEKFREAERDARINNRGLWSDCQDQKATVAPAGNQGQCLIKGNISSSGEKIYHLPDCPGYAETVINEAKGERWFCTEKEATDAGWRKAKNCP